MTRMTRAPVLAALAVAGAAVALAVLAAAAPWLCAWLILCLAFALACRVSWRTTHDTFAPLIPVTAYLFLGFGIRGIALREGWLPNFYNVPIGNQWLIASVWLLAAAAIVSCVLGYRSGTGPRIGQRWGRAAWVHARWPRTFVEGFAVTTALIGAASLVLLRHRFASVSDFGQTPAAVVSQTSEGGLFTIDMLAYFPLAGVLLTWRRRHVGPIGRLATIVNLAILIAWFALAGRKSLLFELVIGLVVLRHYLRKRIRGSTVLMLVVPALILVSLAFYFKDYGFRTAAIAAEYSKKPAWEAVVDPLLDRSYQFDAATMIVDKTRSVSDYRLGSTLDDLLWFYVPRQWWPDKPVSFGYGFAAEFFPGGSQTASYTPSMVGELYLDFGVLGVIFGFYLFGLVLRACYEAFAVRRTYLATAVYVIVLFRLTNMVEGPVSTHIEFLLAEILPLVMFVAASRLLASTADRYQGKRNVKVTLRSGRDAVGAREGSRVA
jgi:Putative O-antigen polymerase